MSIHCSLLQVLVAREKAVKFDLNSQNWKEDIEQSIKDGCDLKNEPLRT